MVFALARVVGKYEVEGTLGFKWVLGFILAIGGFG
jgi:hypothetical protein